MSTSFTHEASVDGVLLRLRRRRLLGQTSVEQEEWTAVGGPHAAAARFLFGLVEAGVAVVKGDGVLLPHSQVARLPATVAEVVGLPPLGTLSITLAFQGIMSDARSRIRASWYDGEDRKIRVERTGAIVSWGSRRGRLSASLLDLTEAIEAYNATEGSTSESRIAAWASVQEALQTTLGEPVRVEDKYLVSLTVYQAGAVALDVLQGADGPDFFPVVMGREKVDSLNDDAPAPEGADDATARPSQRDLVSDALLPKALQDQFAHEIFKGESRSRDAYSLGRNTYLVLDPSLKIALDVIREKRAAPPAERLAFLQNPRADVAAAMGDGNDETASSILVETWQYSERVLALDVWKPPALPWLKAQSGQWLPERFPVTIGGGVIEVDRSVFQTLKTEVASASAEGRAEVSIEGRALSVSDVRDAFQRLGVDILGPMPEKPGDPPIERREAPPVGQEHPGPEQRLVIRQNLDGSEFTVAYAPRESPIDSAFPSGSLVATAPKPHQVVGFNWLVASYRAGWPGVLLADDMGLGKTFQALAFLAWLWKSRASLSLNRGSRNKPFLVVAPTALLQNWIAESERHLGPDALGQRVDAFGSSLRLLKTPKGEYWTPEESLDIARLRAASWVLTTYETLADNHRAFARVAFAAGVFDEAQKIKSPGAINTQSAKAMNIDFVLAMTGTPIETRLADLWCIMDRVVPGYLGDLKEFVRVYENGDELELKKLKAMLDTSREEQVPPVLLRRMKAEILEGLPARKEVRERVPMPPEQAKAYNEAVLRAQAGGTSRGDVLRTIHALRGISLHPHGATQCDPMDAASVRGWIGKSARMRETARVLEQLRGRGEKALVFIEDLDVQALFAAAMATHLGLDRQPSIINGSTLGEKRLEIVDRFQASPPGFGLLVLSPKAAGIGLTITAANHVIHLSRWWNPAVEDQCNDRCYRIGQLREVTIHVPLAVHPDYGDGSFDVRLDALLESRRSLSRDMLLPPVGDGDVNLLFKQTTGRVQ